MNMTLAPSYGPELLRAYKELHSDLTNRGLKPQIQRLDNDASSSLKQTMRNLQVKYQLVPPYSHRRNCTERAIETWKTHYIAGLCITDKLFLMYLVCRLHAQCHVTLIMLRSSRITPTSQYNQLEGDFNLNTTLLAPPGTKALIHENPKQQNFWITHGVSGWYLGPALEHYRWYTVYSTNTSAERVSDVVEFFPSHVHMPLPSSIAMTTKAAFELTQALRHPSPAAPLTRCGDAQLRVLEQLQQIF